MDNLPIADELAAMGIDIDCGIGASIHEEYIPVTKESLQSQVSRVVNSKDEIMEYREAQSLVLTEVQAKLLNAITDRKINEASLRDIVGAYKVLKDKELVTDGKPTEIVGFVGYLMELEEEEKAKVKAEKEKDIIVIQAEPEALESE